MRHQIVNGLLLGIALHSFAQSSLLHAQTAGSGERDRPARSSEPSPERIVSLLPSLTELVFALDKGPDLVGVGDYCRLPPGAAPLPRLGGLSPDVAAVMALSPDLVLADISQERAFAKGEVSGLKVVFLPATRTETIESRLQIIREVGEHLGRSREAADMLSRMNRAIDRVRERVANRPRPRVLYLAGLQPLKIAGRDGIEHDIIQTAGGVNIGEKLSGGSAETSDDFAAGANPDVVLVSQESEVSLVRNHAGWKAVNAIKNDRIHVLDLRHHPDPARDHWETLVEDIERLARILHPDLSADLVQRVGRP